MLRLAIDVYYLVVLFFFKNLMFTVFDSILKIYGYAVFADNSHLLPLSNSTKKVDIKS